MPLLADETQAAFARALRDPTLAPPPGLRGADGAAAGRRFDVYRNNVAIGLIESLEAAFPAVRKLVGDEFFRATASAYIAAEPPDSPILLLYGAGFGAFLDGFPPAQAVPYLGDVARLEHAWHRAYHARDAVPVAIGILANVPARDLASLRLALHPSLVVLRSRWPAAAIWSDTLGMAAEAALDMTHGEDIAVIRPRLDVEVRVLPPGGHAFLVALAGGACLGPAAEAAIAAAPESDLATHLNGLFDLGAVIGARRIQH